MIVNINEPIEIDGVTLILESLNSKEGVLKIIPSGSPGEETSKTFTLGDVISFNDKVLEVTMFVCPPVFKDGSKGDNKTFSLVLK